MPREGSVFHIAKHLGSGGRRPADVPPMIMGLAGAHAVIMGFGRPGPAECEIIA